MTRVLIRSITERRLQQLWVESRPVGGPRPRPGQGRGLDNMVADLPGQPHNQILACRRPDQGVGLDGLNVAGAAGRHDHGRRRRVGTLLRPLQVSGLVGVEVVDDPPGLTLARTHDRVDLDRVGQVVDEVNEHPTLASPSTSDPDTARRGTNASPAARWIPAVCSPAVL